MKYSQVISVHKHKTNYCEKITVENHQTLLDHLSAQNKQSKGSNSLYVTIQPYYAVPQILK